MTSRNEPFPIVDHAGSGRLALIDALRGFALAGVLLVNLGGFSLYYFMDDSARAARHFIFRTMPMAVMIPAFVAISAHAMAATNNGRSAIA